MIRTPDLSEELKAVRARLELEQVKRELAELERPSGAARVRQAVEEAGAIAEAAKKTTDATFGKTPEGNVSIDGTGFEGRVLAFAQAIEIAHEIGRRIMRMEERPSTLIVTQGGDLEGIAAYEATLVKVRALIEAFGSVTEPRERSTEPAVERFAYGLSVLRMSSTNYKFVRYLRQPEPGERGYDLATMAAPIVAAAAPLVPIAAAAVPVAQAAIGLFRSDVDIKSVAAQVTLDAIVAELANHVSPGIKVRSSATARADIRKSELADLLEQLADLREGFAQAWHDDARAHKHGERKSASDAEQIQAQLKSLDDAIASLWKFLDESVPSDGPSPRLTGLLRAEALRQELEKGAMILQLQVAAAGGSTRVRRNWWPFDDPISHTGGAVVTFFVADRLGDSKLSGTVYSYSGYQQSQALSQTFKTNNFKTAGS